MQDQIIKSDGTIVPVNPKNGKDYSLKELKKIVGGYVERIVLRPDQQEMFLNEDGIALRLPLNAKATEIYHKHFKTPNSIYGDVLVCAAGRVK